MMKQLLFFSFVFISLVPGRAQEKCGCIRVDTIMTVIPEVKQKKDSLEWIRTAYSDTLFAMEESIERVYLETNSSSGRARKKKEKELESLRLEKENYRTAAEERFLVTENQYAVTINSLLAVKKEQFCRQYNLDALFDAGQSASCQDCRDYTNEFLQFIGEG